LAVTLSNGANAHRVFHHDYSQGKRTAYRGAYRQYDWENLLFVLIRVPYLGVLGRDGRAVRAVPITLVTAAGSGGRALTSRSSALYRRTRNRTVRTEHTTIARLWFQASAALFAVIEQLAGIGRHQFFGGASAVWAGDNRDQSHKRGPRYQGGGKRRGVIAASVVNNKPQMSADYFSMLQFVVSNLAFAATVLYRTKKCCTPRWRPPIEAASFFITPLAAGSGGWPN
jgi:hypothetical protein